MRFKSSLSILGLALITGTAAFAIKPTFIAKENKDLMNAAGYWTPERLQNAKAMPMPGVDPNKLREIPETSLPKKADGQAGDGKAPEINSLIKSQHLYTPKKNELDISATLDRGTANEEFSSTRLIPLSADTVYPYRTVGKLFFTIPGKGDYVCSASVIRPRVVLTAGHCVHQGSGGADGFYTNFKFIPAFRDGSAPFETWNWSYVITTDTWATGGGVVPNAADYSMIEVKDNTIDGVATRIGSVTGFLGYQTLALIPNHTNMVGYPCNLDSCQKMHQVTAQSAKAVSPNNVEYGSDMRGGSSGSPWVQNFGVLATGQTGGSNPGLNRVVGVTSYGYTSTTPNATGAAIFDSRFTDILNSICSHQQGNCT